MYLLLYLRIIGNEYHIIMSQNRIISSILFLLTFILFQKADAQVCATNYDNPWKWASHATWFTGNGVFINFPGGTGAPVVSTKAFDLGDNTNHAYEGTAAFSDNNGDLIGWSNGRKLWREDGANGILVADDLVAGNEGGSVGERSSAVQGIVAVRHPNIPEKIFIFTSDDVLSPDVGPHYTVYDINTHTSTGPVRLQTDVGSNYRGTEQIDATFHANGNDIWVVIRQSGRGTYNNFRSFYSYLITCNGLNPVPIKSENVVPELGHTFSGGTVAGGIWVNDQGRGALKISWDGTKAATGNHIAGGSDSDEALMVFDFDNATGLLSNCIPFAKVAGVWGWDNAFTNWGAAYDIEWAPNSEGLYVSSISGGGDLQWFDASAGSSAAICSSGKLIYNSHYQFSDIKLGGDGQLYAPGGGSTLNRYAFASEANLNAGIGMTFSTIATGSTVSYGLSNTFIPPIDFTELNGNPGIMDCTDPPVNLGVDWVCRGGSAEDTTVNGWSSDCGGCIVDAARGVFDPSVAGAGTHKVYYQRGLTCSQIDSLEITVTCSNNPCEDTALSNVITPVCIDQTSDLTLFEVTSDAGTWSIVSTPGGSSPATITGGSVFDASGADAGVYRIRFTLDNAPFATCADSAERNITVNELPSISLETGAICAGQTLILDAGNLGSSFQWSTGGVLGGTAQTEVVTTAGPHKVIVTSESTGCIDSAETTVTIYSNPDVSISPPISACTNGAIETLSATPVGGNWYVNDIASNDQLDPTSLSATNHEIKYSYTDENGCSDSDSVSVTINAAPEVDLGPSTFFCSGDSVSLNAGAGYSDYEWSTGESLHVIYVSSPGPISVVVTDANGCLDSSSIQVSANGLPIVPLRDSIVCEKDSITINAEHPDAFSYTWLPGNETDASIKVGSEDATYTVTIVDNDGCEFTDSVQISEEKLPTVSLGSDTTICDNLTKILDAASSSDVSYAWFLDRVIIPDENSPTLEADSGEYIVIVSTANGCESSDSINIDNHQLPNVVIDNEYEFCKFDSVEIDLGNIGESYLWSTGDSTSSIWVYSAGAISAEVTDSNSCVVSVNTTLIENALPAVDLGDHDSACVGLEINLDAEPVVGSAPYTFIWSDGQTDPIYNLVGPDTLSVIVTDSNNCMAYDTIEIAALDSLEMSFDDGDNQVCQGSESETPLNAGSFDGASYTWLLPDGTTETTQEIVPLLNGWYIINVTDEYNCKGYDSVLNVVIPTPNIDLGPDTSFCSLGSDTYTIRMEFYENVLGTISWNDNNNNSNDSLFTARYTSSTVIGTFVDTATGCVHVDSVELTEFCEPTVIQFPNVFVPGSEEGNGTFRPIGITDGNFKDYVNNIIWSDFEVFNRWGLKVFQSSDILPNWDGVYENRPVASGVYYWVYKYKDSSLKEYTFNGFTQAIQTRD